MIKKLLSLYLAVKLQRRIAVYSNTYVNITIWFIVISKEMIKGKTLAFLFSGWKFIKTNNLSRLSIMWTSRVYVIVAIQTIFFIIQRVLMHFFLITSKDREQVVQHSCRRSFALMFRYEFL